MSNTNTPNKYQATQTITLIGAIANIILATMKLIVGWLGQSQSLFADGLHSLSDLLSDALVMVATKFSHQTADKDHPYGHERIETLVTIILGLLLAVVAIGIMLDSIWRLSDLNKVYQPESFTLWIAILSIVIKELLYQYTYRIGLRYRSKLLQANAWHHRSDALSSVIVVLGISMALLGWGILDVMAAFVVAIMIIKMAWELIWQSIQELIDTALEQKIVNQIRQLIIGVDGVRSLHLLRTRRMSSHALVDVHILVSPTISVSEGHQIGDQVRYLLMNDIDEISDVTVHIDPEDDQYKSPCQNLPLRTEVIQKLQQAWQTIEASQKIERIVLHYLQGQIWVDVILPLSVLQYNDCSNQLSEQIIQASLKIEYIGQVNVFYH